MKISQYFYSPFREYIFAGLIIIGLALDYFWGLKNILFAITVIGAVMPFARAMKPLVHGRITIDTFNAFALAISFAAGETRSSAFIILMLLFAYALDWHLIARKNRAVEELMRLKPIKAFRETGEFIEEVRTEDVKSGDIVVVKDGLHIPADGVIVYGEALINESLVTGESVPVRKIVGDSVLGSTICLSGTMKVRATKVGKDSTIERIARLILESSKNKSRAEKMADRFAKIFLPIVLVAGAATYFVTHNILLTASLFLVACADDMAVAMPLAMTASIGKAAKRGVVIKGGEWLDVFSKIKTLIIDKTGTLTYGDIRVGKIILKNNISEKEFWTEVGIAEKLSDHPVGRAIYHEAVQRVGQVIDPESFNALRGAGVSARYGNSEIIIGNADIVLTKQLAAAPQLIREMADLAEKENMSVNAVLINSILAGYIMVRDLPRAEAKESIKKLMAIGVEHIVMFTGDAKNITEKVAGELGISDFRSEMKPENKVKELEKLIKSDGILAMVGDGINDAPALARADIGIAMGGAGTTVAIEAADAIILTDKLNLLPEMILLGRRTMSVIRADIMIWFLSNVVGFALVFAGIFGPALAAFYNFATDFLPLINSARLWRD